MKYSFVCQIIIIIPIPVIIMPKAKLTQQSNMELLRSDFIGKIGETYVGLCVFGEMV